MFPQLAVIAGGVILGVGLLAGTFFLGMRSKNPIVLGAVIWVSRTWLNKVQMRTAGTPGAYAGVVRHVGRVSGRAYETPVSPVPTDDGYAVALVYGNRTSWLRNVLASGHATLVTEGETWEVDQPELVPMGTVERWFTPGDVRSFRRMRVVDALRLRRVRAVERERSSMAGASL